MYRCEDCNNEYEELELHLEADTGYRYHLCPACGSTNLDEIEEHEED